MAPVSLAMNILCPRLLHQCKINWRQYKYADCKQMQMLGLTLLYSKVFQDFFLISVGSLRIKARLTQTHFVLYKQARIQ